jgi:hypothetical protein
MPILILGVVLMAGIARADGGVLRVSQRSASFDISVFTAPDPLRPGSAEMGVLVQTAGAVVVDAVVGIRVRAPSGTEQTFSATRSSSSNPLLHSASVDLGTPGRWGLAVTARRAGTSSTVSFDLDVAPRATAFTAHWLPLALPAVFILLFVWRERLLLRRRPRARQRTRAAP